jgi:hypothetical protein
MRIVTLVAPLLCCMVVEPEGPSSRKTREFAGVPRGQAQRFSA